MYFFFLLIVLFSQQKTPTGQAVLLFDSIVDTEKIEIVDATIQLGEQEIIVVDVQEPEEIPKESVEIVGEVKIEEEVVVENIQQVSDELVEEIEAPLEKVEDQTALSPEEVPLVQEAMTIEEFMTTLSSQTVVIIGENAPIEHLISALQLAGKFGLRVVKESTVEDLFALHAISLGSGYVNTLSASALEQGAIASDEGNYFIYENKETGSVILVVAGGTPKETRKAVHDLLKY